MSNSKYLLKTTKNELEIEFDFIYITYEKDETLTNHNEIKDIQVDNGTKKFVEINLSKTYSDRIVNTPGLLSYNHINEDFLVSISNRNLTDDELNLFNTPDLIDRNTKYIQEDIQEKNIENSLKLFNTKIEENQNIKTFLKTSKKIRTCLEYEDNLEKIKNKNVFSNKRVTDNINTYSKILKTSKRNTSCRDIKRIPNISKNHVSFVLDSEANVDLKERIFIGFLAKKFLKTEENNYSLLSSTFYNKSLNNEEFKTRLLESSYKTTIRDEAVKYGKAYKYVIYPVYYYFVTDVTFIKSGYFICDFPSITTDIVCKESLRPPPPINISGKYNKNNKIFYLKWDLPVNDQQDIKGFQIFRRTSINESFKLVKQIEYHDQNDLYERNSNVLEEEVIFNRNNIVLEYDDSKFDTSKLNIYAICSIDAHGLVSNYSTQIGFVYNFLENKTKADMISHSGAPLFYPNLIIPRKTIFIDNEEKLVTTTPIVSKKNKFTLLATPDCFNYNDINSEEANNISLLKSGENSFYKFSLFRSNNRTIFEDKISIVNYDEN